jgi:hypothetical protein
LTEGSTYRWWDVSCKHCGNEIGECASDRRTQAGTMLPLHWPGADAAWNEAAAHAQSLRTTIEQQAAEIERLRAAMHDYFDAGDAAWAELCQEASKRGVTSMPVLPGQAKALDKYNALRQEFGRAAMSTAQAQKA